MKVALTHIGNIYYLCFYYDFNVHSCDGTYCSCPLPLFLHEPSYLSVIRFVCFFFLFYVEGLVQYIKSRCMQFHFHFSPFSFPNGVLQGSRLITDPLS
jgi:hypothetical protein